MARAFVTDIGRIEITGGVPKLQAEVIFGGVDVPGTYQNKGVMVDIAGVTTVAELHTALAAGIRALAAQHGYTVGANLCFLPSYVAA